MVLQYDGYGNVGEKWHWDEAGQVKEVVGGVDVGWDSSRYVIICAHASRGTFPKGVE